MDPFLADQGTYPAFSGTDDSHLRNSLVSLKTPMDRILDVDAVIVTHLHIDHWDEAAVRLVPKEMPIFVQDFSETFALRQKMGRAAAQRPGCGAKNRLMSKGLVQAAAVDQGAATCPRPLLPSILEGSLYSAFRATSALQWCERRARKVRCVLGRVLTSPWQTVTGLSDVPHNILGQDRAAR
jgi:hypothetical protein